MLLFEIMYFSYFGFSWIPICGSTSILNCLNLSVRGPSLDVKI